MTGKTHLMAGLLSGIWLTQLAGADLVDGMILTGICCVGSLAPDIDHPHSTINGIIPFFRWTHLIVGHRGVLHAGFIPVLLIASYFSSVPLEYLLKITSTITGADILSLPQWIIPTLYAFGVGWLSHIILDALTPRGVPILYPWKKPINLLPKFLAIRTGGFFEVLFLIGLWVILLATVYQLLDIQLLIF